MKNANYLIYRVTRMEKGVVKSSEAIYWSRKTLKEIRNECKKEHYSWPYYYILRRTKRSKIMYKP
jgi:hypothetical protein